MNATEAKARNLTNAQLLDEIARTRREREGHKLLTGRQRAEMDYAAYNLEYVRRKHTGEWWSHA